MWKKLRKSRFSTIHFLRVFLIKSRNLWNPLFQSVIRHSTYNIKYSINFPRIHHIYIPYIRSINYSTTYHLTKKKKRKTKNKNPSKVNFAPSPTSSIVLTRIWPFIEHPLLPRGYTYTCEQHAVKAHSYPRWGLHRLPRHWGIFPSAPIPWPCWGIASSRGESEPMLITRRGRPKLHYPREK